MNQKQALIQLFKQTTPVNQRQIREDLKARIPKETFMVHEYFGRRCLTDRNKVIALAIPPEGIGTPPHIIDYPDNPEDLAELKVVDESFEASLEAFALSSAIMGSSLSDIQTQLLVLLALFDKDFYKDSEDLKKYWKLVMSRILALDVDNAWSYNALLHLYAERHGYTQEEALAQLSGMSATEASNELNGMLEELQRNME